MNYGVKVRSVGRGTASYKYASINESACYIGGVAAGLGIGGPIYDRVAGIAKMCLALVTRSRRDSSVAVPKRALRSS
jgi:hypothetical protein